MTRFVVHDETAITSTGRTEQKEKKRQLFSVPIANP